MLYKITVKYYLLIYSQVFHANCLAKKKKKQKTLHVEQTHSRLYLKSKET